MSFLSRPRVRIPTALSLVISLLTISLVASTIPPVKPAFATTCANDGSVTFYVSGSTCVGVLTVADTSPFTPPSDWNNSNNEIEVIGAGGDGAASVVTGASGAGGGGGAYASTTNVSVSGTASFQVGIRNGGGTTMDTWFGSTGTVDAGGGSNGSGTTAGPAGTVKAGHGYSGGIGGSGSATADTPGGGGGGAAGPGKTTAAGTGGGGGNAASTAGRGGSGGGGAGGTNGVGSIGSASTGTTGGAGGSGNGGSGSAGTGATGSCTSANNGSGGGGSGGGNGIAAAGTAGTGCSATSDTDWTVNSTAYGSGSGGGGGGSDSRTAGNGNNGGKGGAGGTYGGGGGGGGSGKNANAVGGFGGAGLIIITYTPVILKPTVTTNSAETFTPTTATLFGSITNTGGADATQSGFAYSTNSTLDTSVSTTTLSAQTGTASFNGAITGLSANTTYYYRAYATNSAGTGYGSILSFTTGDTTPARKMILFQGYKIKILPSFTTSSSVISLQAGTPVTVEASVFGSDPSVAALDSSHVAYAYADATNNVVKISICSISGTTPACGTPVTIASVVGQSVSAAALDSSHIAVAYADETNSPLPPRVAICSVSGTTPTCGAPVTVDSIDSPYASVTALSSSVIAVAFEDDTNSPLPPKVAICTVSGTTPSCGTPVTVASVDGVSESVASLDTSHIAISYGDSTNGAGKVAVCSVSGTTPTCGTPVTIASGGVSNDTSIASLDSSHIAEAYEGTTSPFPPTVAICSVSGTTPTCGAPLAIKSSIEGIFESVASIDSSDLMVTYADNTNSPFPPYDVLCSVSGTTPTCSTPVKIASVQAGSGQSVTSFGSAYIALAYQDGTNSPFPPKIAIDQVINNGSSKPTIVIYQQ